MKLTAIFNLLATAITLAAPIDQELETALNIEARDASSSDLLPRAGDDYPYKTPATPNPTSIPGTS